MCMASLVLLWHGSPITERNHQICGSYVSSGIFTMYTYPMGDIIRRHNINYHPFADDTQLYVEFDLNVPVHALITSRLDYCYSFLLTSRLKTLKERKTKKFKKIQTRSAVLVFLANRRDDTSPLIKELHWLPVKERISFKIVLHVYRCLNNPAPIYLTELLQIYISSANLRSGLDHTRLVSNRTSTIHRENIPLWICMACGTSWPQWHLPPWRENEQAFVHCGK